MTEPALKLWPEPDEQNDPRNDALDSIERLIRTQVAGDSAMRFALKTRLERLLGDIDQDDEATATFDPHPPAQDLPIDELEVDNLLSFLSSLRRSVRSDQTRLQLLFWRRRVSQMLIDMRGPGQ